MERALIDKSVPPTDVNLQEVLNESYKYYMALMDKTKKFENK